MARVVVAGAGAIGASIAYHLALHGADDVVLADVGEIAGGATGKAMGGVRQQFRPRPRCGSRRRASGSSGSSARRCSSRSATSSSRRRGRACRARASGARSRPRSACPSRASTRRVVGGLRVDDVLGATICREDGIADPAGVTRELVRRAAALGVEVRERTDALDARRGHRSCVACGASRPRWRGRAASSFRFARSSGSSPTSARRRPPADLPMTIEENGFHFRRVGDDGLRLAMSEPRLRWDGPGGTRGPRRGLARAPPSATRRRPERRSPGPGPALRHDPGRAPDHRARRRRALRRLRLLGHGFMQSPAVGDAVAAELLGETPPFDLSPYRLERFEGGAIFPETLVL